MGLNNPRRATRRAARRATARERIDQAAYDLFSQHGIRAVGIDQMVAESGVAKATLYRHYPTKNHLALAFLRRREELWTRAWLQLEVERRGGPAGARLLAIFDAFDVWFHRPSFEGCTFVNVMLETDSRDRIIRAAAIAHLATLRAFLKQLSREAGARDPENLSWQWHILMKGSIIAAGEGDRNAARRARDMGLLLLQREGIGVNRRDRQRDTGTRVIIEAKRGASA
jgi:AcrR family transcriptional regulator